MEAKIQCERLRQDTNISQTNCNSVSKAVIVNNKPKAEHHVIDEDTVIGEIAMSYAASTTQHYGLATADFDEYSEGPSIRDNPHQRCGQNIHPVVKFTPLVSGKRHDFLSWDCNKQHVQSNK